VLLQYPDDLFFGCIGCSSPSVSFKERTLPQFEGNLGEQVSPDMALRPDCTALAVPVEKMDAYWVAKPEKVSTFIGWPLWAEERGDIDPPCANSRRDAHCYSTEMSERCRHGISARLP
jgi:hypothetical protein